MRFVFVLGVGRSGTTLLGRLMAATSTPARFVSELCPGIHDRIPNPVFMVAPEDEPTQERVREALHELAMGKMPFGEEQARRIERNDGDAEVVIVKDVHSLLAWPSILQGLADWRAVVITRDTLRVLDSYLHGHRPGGRRYLVEEYAYLSRLVRAPARSQQEQREGRISRVLASLPPGCIRTLGRPRILTTELARQAVTTELLRRFLREWAEEEERVAHVSFEDLCRDPMGRAGPLLEFLGLDASAQTYDSIRRMTTGSEDGYYATHKDSGRILEQPYRVLGGRRRRRLAALLGGAR